MKTDRLTKLLLMIIAINLSVIVLRDIRLGIPAYANDGNFEVNGIQEKEYGLVPLNNDGSITVKLAAYDELRVDIVDISTSDALNVDIDDISTSDELNINIDEIGGWSVYNSIPVEIED